MTATLTPAVRTQALIHVDGVAARLAQLELHSDTLDRVRTALEDSHLVGAQTAANELELVLGGNGFLPDDDLAKLRYLLAEGSPALEARYDFATPDDPGTDLQSIAAARAANAWLARRQTEGAA